MPVRADFVDAVCFGFEMSDVVVAPISALIDAYYGELRSYASRKLRNPVAAEDIVQEAWLRFASSGNEKIANPRAYLYRLVGNLVIDQQRREQTRIRTTVEPPGHLDVVDETVDMEGQLVARQRLALLAKAVSELPPRCRDCFILRRFDDLGPDEIARRMGISRNMVEKHLRQALVHCAKRLREGD
jgi:RNA polymerase sigma-70 factor (ECF subfamily)